HPVRDLHRDFFHWHVVRPYARRAARLDLGPRWTPDARRHYLHICARLDRHCCRQFPSSPRLQFHDCRYFDHCHQRLYPHASRTMNRTSRDSFSVPASATIEARQDDDRMYVAQPIEWTERGVVMLDQRRLPAEEVSFTYTDYREVAEARQIHFEKKATDEAIGSFGAEFMPREGQVMTQCNAGALATAGIGTALGVIRVAFEQGRKLHVLVPETRPYLQGARLTAWE